MYLLDYVN